MAEEDSFSSFALDPAGFRSSSPVNNGVSNYPAIDLSPVKSLTQVQSFSADVSSCSTVFEDVVTCSSVEQATLEFMDISVETSVTSVESTARSLLTPNFNCCKSRCIALIPPIDIEHCRKIFRSRSRQNQQQFILDLLSMSVPDTAQCKASYRLLSRDVCKLAFVHTLGISKKRFRKICRLHNAGVTTTTRSPRIYKKSSKHDLAKAWMSRYFNRIGDKMPHIEQTHLPNFLSKRAVYDIMCKELLEQGLTSEDTLSLSRFYALWADNFSSCVIPKVSIY